MQLTKQILIEYLGFLGVKEESIQSIDRGKWCLTASIKKDPYLFDIEKNIDRFPYIVKALDRTFRVTPEKWMRKGCYEFRVFVYSQHSVMEYEAAKDIFLRLKDAGFHINPLMVGDDGYVLRIKAGFIESAGIRVNQLKELEEDIRKRGWRYRMSDSHEFVITYRCHQDLGFGRASK